jgi:hypothetical protein
MAYSALSWEPKRRGDIYCAPACGSGCTLAEYKDAVKRAETLAKRLGPGWTPRVHENLGWHSRAIDATGFWKISVSREYRTKKLRYLAFLGENDIGGRWAEGADTPEAAIDAVLAIARQEFAVLENLVRAGENAVTKKPVQDAKKVQTLKKGQRALKRRR